ncbi:hypothetical protein DVH24_001142 [Malus domestica]|uniref:Uncharacterized protein n=1 Tax=Malus domestica TaxID=3750 RepID=A0A498K0U3_MALDO|nr:hypothetical protein DVH24_001142 [Malus domestica]
MSIPITTPPSPMSTACCEDSKTRTAPTQTASFEAISGQTTASWPACKFPASPTAFEAFSGQTTAS